MTQFFNVDEVSKEDRFINEIIAILDYEEGQGIQTKFPDWHYWKYGREYFFDDVPTGRSFIGEVRICKIDE